MLKNVRKELKNISFPTRRETLKNTCVIILISFISSAFLAALNAGVTEAVNLIISLF